MTSETATKEARGSAGFFSRLLRVVVTLCFVTLLFLNLPSLVTGHGHSHDEPPSFKYSQAANARDAPPPPTPTIDRQDLWLYALGSTLLISLAPFLILLVIPLDNSPGKKPLLKILLAFASGGLLGDAFLHLIPHALAAAGNGHDDHQGHGHGHSHGHGHDHGHSHGAEMNVGLWVLAGILLFLFVEKSIRLLKGGHSHSHGAPEKVANKDQKKTKGDNKPGSAATANLALPPDTKIAGYLNLAADFTHNFTDGLAIGASFLAGKGVGILTTVTILFHEVPHEIGDFAILIQSGCSKKKAMCLQLLTALGAFSGTLVSLMADGYGDAASSWVLPLTAGGFIYIATVSVIPDLLEDTSFFQSIKEILALIFGVYMMVVIASYE